ncbi:MAG TPA: L-threonylcarbamoyladenylate synthase, partial [Bryobacteraceae bacterium]|nr:L-threonylcarbamoyladenylate synthase [Bryobacteraceae bacterium]
MEKTNSRIEQAAALIRAGELVAFPTETVYGLGANALDAGAVDKIFAAKNRPRSSPLIVHVDSVEMARGLVEHWPDSARKLADKFWPGPLTLVLKKNARIPGNVTAGLDTVGVRMPAHPTALALIQASGVPIAAPSANRFTQLSPTTAGHVQAAFGSDVFVLDEGPAPRVGIESTVLSLAGKPELLRPGMIARLQIEEVIGAVKLAAAPSAGAHASPGLHHKHYSPRTPLFLVTGQLPAGKGVYLYWNDPLPATRAVAMPQDAAAYGAALYAALHEAD